MDAEWKSRLTASQITVIVLASTKENDMSENEFKIRRVTYVAVIGESCDGCAFDYMGELCLSAPQCAKEQRSDGLDVIFVKEIT